MNKVEIFAMLCAVENLQENTTSSGSWTTGSGTGSDPDD